MGDSFDKLRGQAQAMADAAIASGSALTGLTDQYVTELLIRRYFQTLKDDSPRRLVDVGAAYGSVADVFLRDGWSVEMFEPDPACQQVLQRLLAAYPRRCRLHPYAVADRNEDSVNFQQNATPGLSGLSVSPFGQTTRSISVRCVKLADVLPEMQVQKVDFLKIDTEGHDFEVLRGYDFAALPPRLVFIEYSFYFSGQHVGLLQEAIESMAKQGYSAVLFDYNDHGNFRRGNWSHQLTALSLDGRLPSRGDSFGNVLFHRPDDEHLMRTVIDLVQGMSRSSGGGR
jgi:FkbM family methyltransferase